MALFEGYERKIDKINGVLAQYGLESVEACREICTAKGFDPYEIVKGIQPIAFEEPQLMPSVTETSSSVKPSPKCL